MKPPGLAGFSASPIVQRACKFLKIGNKNSDSPRRKTYKGISFSNDVYQETCQPLEDSGESSWRRSLSLPRHWNSASNFPADEHSKHSGSRRSSIRMYSYPWGRKSERESSKSNDYVAVEEIEKNIEMNEGIFTIELAKPPNGYLGLVLVGGTDTPLQKHYVKDILPNSAAFKAGSLRIGDELIEVNGHTLRGRTHSLALAVIRSLPPVIKLVIERSKDGNRAILSSYQYDDSIRGPDPNITSPKARTRKRSVLDEANESSIITKTVYSVINVQRSAVTPLVKPAKLLRRESRCTSFIGADDSEDDDDVMAFGCEETKSNKEGRVPEESSDYDDRLSLLSNTSAWCARQMMSSKQDDQLSSNHDTDSIETTSVFSMSTLSDSLPPPYSEDEYRTEQIQTIDQTTLTRHGSQRGRRTVTESIIEVASDEEYEEVPEEPPMFLRRGSLRAGGTFILRTTGCEESEEDRTTWPITTRRQRTSLNWDTFVPPPNTPVRRSASACVRRPSSMYVDNVPSNLVKPRSTEQPNNLAPRKLQRTNSGKYIDKKTLTTKVYRVPSTGDWSFTIAGGSYSPYGDLPIHVLDVQDSVLAGVLKNGDEIVAFGGENFSTVTFLEADKKMKHFDSNCATVIMKRKFLQRKKAQVCNSYADAWNEQARTARQLKSRPESLYC